VGAVDDWDDPDNPIVAAEVTGRRTTALVEGGEEATGFFPRWLRHAFLTTTFSCLIVALAGTAMAYRAAMSSIVSRFM